MEEIYLGKIYNKKTFIIFVDLKDLDYFITSTNSYILFFVNISFETKPYKFPFKTDHVNAQHNIYITNI